DRGQPLALEFVELIKIGEDGQPQSASFNHAGIRVTNDEGVYRITGVPEGRYLVRTSIPFGNRINRPYYPKTFHPGVTDQAQAKIVGVSEGAEIAGVDIVIARELETHQIKGRVVHAETGEPAAGIEIYYSHILGSERGVVGPRGGKGRANSAGEFQLEHVL